MTIQKLVSKYESNDGQRVAMILERGIGYRVTMFDSYFETSKETFTDNLQLAELTAMNWVE